MSYDDENNENIYDTNRLQRLFNEMSATYGIVNFLSSFGFTRRWRRQCVDLADLKAGDRVCDLMTGRGECWGEILKRTDPENKIHSAAIMAVDFSPVMIEAARKKAKRAAYRRIEVLERDVFQLQVPAEDRYDAVVCSFGVKTLAPELYASLAALLLRLLKPGGRFAFLEISVPPARVLRWPLQFYLRFVIPRIGKICLGNPDNYRMLGVYTRAFQNSARLQKSFQAAGLRTRYRRFFFGSATAVAGTTPNAAN